MKKRAAPARKLRRNQTDAERVLWFRLRDRRLAGWKFKRQVPIDKFFADFVCAERKLVIEIDGGQHDPAHDRTSERTQLLEAMWYFVLRFWNHDVMRNTDGVVETIIETLNQ